MIIEDSFFVKLHNKKTKIYINKFLTKDQLIKVLKKKRNEVEVVNIFPHIKEFEKED